MLLLAHNKNKPRPLIKPYRSYRMRYLLARALPHALNFELDSMSAHCLRRVLLLGSGYTSAPLVECLTRDGTVAVTVGKTICPKIA